ncbi:NAD(P)-binding domain-containing protein [Ureaplasma miroungigenitalium]|uniref:NAD(P)-binding domain-containing protein n=1 Tax=Ureaplasma miroungigenitalium TaxID=1042321 RepID=A0ABT3BLX8_9BACT|nr:NAD(P)H-dependent glycerol-3-phosphate dehydrogenase [Ureaplasma miroungigenitalium]MCV3728249.1 NAD(P)-binding domain-containing protein [Ureaplasma miroungigenitalium]MCV3734053.1 NAD(P)-binding domain-containing protein [Ureaplasma miroungigenitalium]
MSKYLIIGSGAFGSALSQPLLANQHQVDFYSINTNELNEIKNQQTNQAYFGQQKFLGQINQVYNDLTQALTMNVYERIILCVPSNALRSVIDQLKLFNCQQSVLINASKGMDLTKLQLWNDVLEQEINCAGVFCLSGPSFAVEVFVQKPTKINLLGNNEQLGQAIIKDFSTPWFSLAFSTNVKSANFFASMKNVLAIGCGLVQGLYESKNALCAYLTKGVQEVLLLAHKVYQTPTDDFIDYYGLGDLILTCTDQKSRNFQFGLQLSKQKASVLLAHNKTTTEGLDSLCGVYHLLQKHHLNTACPLLDYLYQVVYDDAVIMDYMELIFHQ